MEDKQAKVAQTTNDFTYTYSAKKKADLQKIRAKYEIPAAGEIDREAKMTERLYRLDKGVTVRARTVALIVGIVGALILGIGMSLCMSEFRTVLGAYREQAMPIGIGIGLVGALLVGIAYPLYRSVLKKGRAKIAPEILRLTDELLKQNG